MLDRETIDKIEELHGAVVRAEAEQRFGLLRGKRTRQLTDAEIAEQSFLAEHGFATYNDFRLRIRRSTVVTHEEEPEQVVEWFNDPQFEDDGFSGADTAPSDDEDSQEGSEQMGPLPESAPAPAAPAPTAVAPAPPSAFSPRPDGDHVASSAADLRRVTEPLFATLQAETDRFVAARIETAEKQAAEILNRASREASEIVGRAARMHDAVRSLVDDITRQSESFLSLTEELPSRVDQIREGVGADLRALRELADSGPSKPTALSEPTTAWNAPARVAPPPPVPAAD